MAVRGRCLTTTGIEAVGRSWSKGHLAVFATGGGRFVAGCTSLRCRLVLGRSAEVPVASLFSYVCRGAVCVEGSKMGLTTALG